MTVNRRSRRMDGVMAMISSLLFCLSIPVLSAAKAEPRPQDSPHAVVEDPAYALARFLNSEERAHQLWEHLLKVMPTVLRQDPSIAHYLVDYPELADQVMVEIQPIMIREYQAALPGLWSRIATVYRANLSAEEARQMLSHFSSPAKVKLTRELIRRIDLAHVMQGATDTLDPRRAQEAVAQAYPLALATLSSAERAEVSTFDASPLADKSAKLIGPIQAERAAWRHELLAALRPTVEQMADRLAKQQVTQ
ncbi:hypothetical protein NYR55_07860 [Sphingomonas sp. BGYR3]|uniref:hypothetical protein n=1 Tax=Sphingomonas sp. BGYR3 TaxID=2975483 RepID=UPI0021A809FA|nr:hypothetical protein [Sphingomonas sp. BGYR3]MDG5488528.1 hypothetical protein [Sphingomonas sp. BGYR3]